jgi:site-specific DNA-methyltransferase (adenine-specific)
VSATCTFHVGDALTVMRSLPAASVDLLLTSPPFLALRSYLPPGHPDKAKEMGSEPTPGEFIDALLDVVEEGGRVLAPHGSLCIELGDTYAGSGGAGGDYGPGGLREGQELFDGSGSKHWRTPEFDGSVRRRHGAQREAGGRLQQGAGWPLDKSLCLVPELLRFAMAYGFNPLTGRQTPRWRVRNVVRWCRPNPPVGALADKFRPATSEMVVACKSRSRYFDLDAVRGPGSENTHARTAKGVQSRPSTGKTADDERRGGNFSSLATLHSTEGAPPLDWWQVSTEPYKGSHYATWPRALLTRPILAMCPERVCAECGEPSRRIAETTNAIGSAVGRRSWRHDTEGKHSGEITASISSAPTADRRILGWTDCGHNAYRPGVVLDPFAGTGTTGLVATGHGRSAVLIDLDARNLDLARERIGMFLTEGVMEATA